MATVGADHGIEASHVAWTRAMAVDADQHRCVAQTIVRVILRRTVGEAAGSAAKGHEAAIGTQARTVAWAVHTPTGQLAHAGDPVVHEDTGKALVGDVAPIGRNDR